MKNRATKTVLSSVTLSALVLAGCATAPMGPGMGGPGGYGMSPGQGMAQLGPALVETVLSTAIGAGTGALMRNQPGWANGAVSSAAGAIGNQLVNALAGNGGYQRASYHPQPQYSGYGGYSQYQQPQGGYYTGVSPHPRYQQPYQQPYQNQYPRQVVPQYFGTY